MIQKELIFVDCFDSTFKGENYTIFQFLDPTVLTVINGSNLGVTLEKGKVYKCVLDVKSSKVKVIEVK